jgi:hypothetical protein
MSRLTTGDSLGVDAAQSATDIKHPERLVLRRVARVVDGFGVVIARLVT